MGREAAKERVDRVAALTAVRTAAVGLLVLAYVWHVMFTYVYTADILRLHCALLYCLLYCAFLLSVPSWRTIRAYAQYSECLSGLSPPYAYPVHMCTCACADILRTWLSPHSASLSTHSPTALLPPTHTMQALVDGGRGAEASTIISASHHQDGDAVALRVAKRRAAEEAEAAQREAMAMDEAVKMMAARAEASAAAMAHSPGMQFVSVAANSVMLEMAAREAAATAGSIAAEQEVMERATRLEAATAAMRAAATDKTMAEKAAVARAADLRATLERSAAERAARATEVKARVERAALLRDGRLAVGVARVAAAHEKGSSSAAQEPGRGLRATGRE